MKTFKYLSMAAVAALAMLSCTKPENETDDPSTPDEPVVELSTACRLTKVIATSGASSRECTVYEKEKEVDVLEIAGYDLSQMSFAISISDKATCDFDASKVYDLTGETPLTITVTAEDTTCTATYTFTTRIPDLAFNCEQVWVKTVGALGITNSFTPGAKGCPVNASIAFCGTDKFVTSQGYVFNFEGSKMGSLDMTGVCDDEFLNIANDVNGIVVASAVAHTDEENPETVSYGEFYAWLDGWYEAPTLLYTNKPGEGEEGEGNPCAYMSCGGDINGDFIITSITNGRDATTMHHLFEFHDGNFEDVEWHAFTTEYVSNDGNWGQMVSPTSGNIDGWFVIGDSNGNNLGYSVYTRQGIEDNFDDNELWGTTWPDGLIPDGAPEGNHWYGNYSTGHVRGFQFKGIDYVVATTTGWPCTYVTIQGMVPEWIDETDPDTGDVVGSSVSPDHYLMRTMQLNGAQVTPSSSYIYDEATDTGYVITCTGSEVVLWSITGDVL